MSTITPGLVSVTFRGLSADAVSRFAAENGLMAIEWGGDVHCPAGDLAAARRVARLTADAGLRTFAYGSYYKLGGAPGSPRFADVLTTVLALGAPSIRVWAGTVASAAATVAERDAVTRDLAAIADVAAREGVVIAVEYHADTLTDAPESAVALLRAASRPNVASYWQPRHGRRVEEHLADLAALRPWLRDVHAFHWWPGSGDRRPLAEGADRWRDYLGYIASDGRPHVAALEFVRGDHPDALPADAAALHAAIAATRTKGSPDDCTREGSNL